MRRSKRRLSMGAVYILAILIVVVAAGGFALFYGDNKIEASLDATPDPGAVSPTPPAVETDVLLVPYCSGDTWGYKSNTGEIRIEAQFTDARPFSEGYAFASVNQNGQTLYGVIDESGSWVIDPLYQDARSFVNGCAAVKYNDKWGFINATGAFVAEPTYQEAGSFCDGLARVKSNDKWGYIDTTGQMVISNQYDEAGDFSEGLAFVGTSGDDGMQYYLITDSEEVVSAVTIEEIGVYSENYALVKNSDGKYIFLSRLGRQGIDGEFSAAGSFSNGLAAVQVDGLWGYIDATGKIVIEPQFAAATAFSADGYAAVQNAEGLWGYIDKIGAFAIECQYTSAQPFENGYAVVTKNVECGLIDVYNNYKTLYLLDSTSVPDGDEGDNTGDTNTQQTGKVNATELNVREEPSTDAKILTKLKNGDSVTILGEEDGWYQIQTGDTKGYVSKDYIKIDE